jgi:hypothetical protein
MKELLTYSSRLLTTLLASNSLFLILGLEIILSVTFRAGAQTSVSGTIITQVWTSNNSPYNVVGDITVAGLTIGPGVTVNFDTNYAFEVDGVLIAGGTPDAPIVFKGTNGWKGIYFNISSPGSILANCIISNSVSSGVQIYNSNPLLENCVIAKNRSSTSGGGVAIVNTNMPGPVILQNCSITDNTAVQNGGGVYALLGTNSSLQMTGCLISNNISNPSVVNENSYGGGVFANGKVMLGFCEIRNNTCHGGSAFSNDRGGFGGGILSSNGTSTLLSCVIAGNSVVTTGGGISYGYGGGVTVLSPGTLWATNTVIGSNSVSGSGGFGTVFSGGGISMQGTNGAIVNCTIAYNNLEGLVAAGTNFPVLNSILYFNANNGNQIVGSTNVTYCDVQNGIIGTGNINHNPIFLSPANLIIVPGSPCIDAGSTNSIYKNTAFPPSLGTTYSDIGAHGGPGAGAILGITAWPVVEVDFYGGVPGYNYIINASTNLFDWAMVEPVQLSRLGQTARFIESDPHALSYRFYDLVLAP